MRVEGEPYEALEPFEPGDEQAFRQELGDVLLQVVFHEWIAAERDDGTGFTVDDVADGIVDKLVRRHPHVFGDLAISGADEVKRNWDQIKREEKRTLAERQGRAGCGQAVPSVLDGVPFGQLALALATQLQRRAAQAGVPDELACLDGEDEVGAQDGPPKTSAVSSSAWSRGPASWAVTLRWSCVPPWALPRSGP